MGPRIRFLATLALATIAAAGFLIGVSILDRYYLHLKLALFLNDASRLDALEREYHRGLAALAASALAGALLFARCARWAIREIREAFAEPEPLPFN